MARPSTFAELLEQLWQARHDGDVLVRFSGGKPQYIELITSRRVWCVEPVRDDAAEPGGPARTATTDALRQS